MTAERRADRNVLWILAGGFALTIVLLIGSGWLGVRAVDAVETHTERLLAQHRFSTQLIDEIQGEKAGLSSLLYSLAARPGRVDRQPLLLQLEMIERDVRKTLAAARQEATAREWATASQAVEVFIREVRALVAARTGEMPQSLMRAHEEVARAIAELVSANYRFAVEQEGQESSEHLSELSRSLVLLGGALVLSILCALATVRLTLRMFRRAEWQARELERLSEHVLETQEQMLRRFSRELHDEFGQSLTAIEANLAAVPVGSAEVSARIEDCTLLVKDLMSNVREMSQLLRPSTLDDFGLKPSLVYLGESVEQRTGIRVETQVEFDGRLEGELETHLYRIAQEALTNVTRHSRAKRVEVGLTVTGKVLRLRVADDGGGFSNVPRKGPGGLGIAGMRERMRIVGGRLEARSDGHGVTVIAEVKLNGENERRQGDPRVAG